MNEKFEYKMVSMNYKKSSLSGIVGFELAQNEDILIGEGLAGWEAVTTINVAGYTQYVLMKRKIESEE